ncbi:hypothetical protein Bca4012_036119 [Brassica carinata]
MHHLCPRSRRHPSLSRGFAACQALVRFFALHRIKPHAPPLVRAPVNSFEFHSCERTPQAGYLTRLLGYLIPFAPLAFVSQCQCRPSRVLSPLVFFPISTHFTAPPEIPSAPTVLKLDALRPIIPDNACILCITAAAGTELADAYSPDTVIVSSLGKEESGPCLSPSVADHPLGPATDHRLGKLLPHQLANQTRAPPRADSSFCSSAYGVLAAVSSCCSPPKGRFLRVTHPSATGNTTSRPTCIFIVALLIASFFVDKADSELSFIPSHNLLELMTSTTSR